MKSWFHSRLFWQAMVVVCSVIYPRVAFLGAFPYMDEGFYAWQSMQIAQHIQLFRSLPPTGGLSLYPLLTCWLYWLPGNIILWFRLADMFVAACAGWIFCQMLRREAGDSWAALCIAFTALCCMNLEPVINAGFKNSFFAAYIPLFTAVWLSGEPGARRKWAAIGACVALAVLLRETFAPFALLGLGAIALAYGRDAALRYAFGGLATAVMILGAICVARGNWAELVLAYTQATGVYVVQSGQVLKKFLENGGRALEFFCPLIIIAAASCVYRCRDTHKRKRKTPGLASRSLFWFSAAFLPLLEPASKIGFLYHFSVCLPGLAGLAAWNCREFPFICVSKSSKIIRAILILACAACLCFLPGPQKFLDSLREVSRISQSFSYSNKAAHSNTPAAAKIIEQNLPPDGTLAVSGFTHFLYAVCKALPPAYGPFAKGDIYKLSDLARSYRALGMDSAKLAAALAQNPPDVIAIAHAKDEHEPDYYEGVTKAIEMSGQYEPAGNVSADAAKNYGWLSYDIFRRRK